MTGRRDGSLGPLGRVLPAAAADLAGRQLRDALPRPVAFWVRTIRAIETDLTAGMPRLLRRQLPQRLVEVMAAQIVAGIEVVVDDVLRREEEAS